MENNSAAKYEAMLLGIFFFVNGLLIIKHKKYGPEEGLWGPTFKGNFAIFIAIIFLLLGLGLMSSIFVIK